MYILLVRCRGRVVLRRTLQGWVDLRVSSFIVRYIFYLVSYKGAGCKCCNLHEFTDE